MSVQLIHVVGATGEARLWLVHTLMNGITGCGVSGTLVDVLDADTHDNEALRGNAHVGSVAIVVSETHSARHCDLAEQDIVLRLEISPYAAQLAAEVQRLAEQVGNAQCAYIIEQARK